MTSAPFRRDGAAASAVGKTSFTNLVSNEKSLTNGGSFPPLSSLAFR
jgi:hypothetical protein